MKRYIFLFLWAFPSVFYAQVTLTSEITQPDLKKHLGILASDSLGGRFPGSYGGNAASKYIASSFKSAGLMLYNKTGFQPFEVLTNQEPGKNNMLQVSKKRFKMHSDFLPFPFSSNGTVKAEIVFAGYGLEVKTDSFEWADYANVDVKGKVVLLLRGTPEAEKYQQLFSSYSDDIVKSIIARDKGAVGVLFVSGKKYDEKEPLVEMNLRESAAGIPVFHIKREVANAILPKEQNIETLENQVQTKPLSFAIKNQVSLTSQIIKHNAQTSNVIGIVYAPDTTLVKSYVVVGAHYDHLGMGGPGSSSRRQDTTAVHNGADDNASGVSAILEVAAKLSQVKGNLKQNVIFVAFGAEEMGILGSKFFLDHPIVPVSSIKAMINLDMVGRLREDTMLQVNGTGTSKEAVDLIINTNKTYNFSLRMSAEGYGPSDHAAFYSKNIPVFYLSTGAHADYHTPIDDSEKINFPGLEKVSLFTFDLLTKLAYSDSRLSFQEAGPQQASSGGRRYKITLGIMPDVNATTDNGLLVEFVTKGKPAYNGGMLKGDIITSVDGKPVKNIQDYMVRLSQLKAGKSVHVEVLRNGKTELLIIQL